MGVGAMVFGSPKNRQRGDMPYSEAYKVAAPFFAELGKVAHEQGVEFCIEPNAEQYACDFVTTAQHGTELVEEVNTPGFGLHLDIACMFLANDNIAQSIERAKTVLKHFHISAPMLGDVPGDSGIDYEGAAKALRAINYDGFVSIEMRPGENTLERVEAAVKFAQTVYKS
jgi:sugar phosphate isomerase/epimerase